MSQSDLNHHAQPRCPICLSPHIISARGYRATLPGSAQVFSGLSIRTCQTCSASFAHPLPPVELLATYYATHYRAEGSRHRLRREPSEWDGGYIRARSQFEFVSRRVKHSLNQHSINSWLDIGAGYGCLLDEAKQHGFKRTGAVEPDQHGRARIERQGYQTYDDLSQVDGSWDVISFSHLLEHLSSPVGFLTRIKDLLSDSGYIFCEVPNVVDLQNEKNDAPHLLFFTMPALSRLFKAVGLEVLTLRSCGSSALKEHSPNIQQILRRVAMRLFKSPPTWLDRAIHPHFRYSRTGDRVWIRVLARKHISHFLG